jgi:hypothetical protein
MPATNMGHKIAYELHEHHRPCYCGRHGRRVVGMHPRCNNLNVLEHAVKQARLSQESPGHLTAVGRTVTMQG